jgi:hypothetical protein
MGGRSTAGRGGRELAAVIVLARAGREEEEAEEVRRDEEGRVAVVEDRETRRNTSDCRSPW